MALCTTLDAASHAVPDLKPNPVGVITEASDWTCYTVDIQPSAIPSGRSGGVIDAIVMELRVGPSVAFQKNDATTRRRRIESFNFPLRLPIRRRNMFSPT